MIFDGSFLSIFGLGTYLTVYKCTVPGKKHCIFSSVTCRSNADEWLCTVMETEIIMVSNGTVGGRNFRTAPS